MKRKLNENYAFPVKIDVVQLVHDYPELEGNMDDLATHIEDTNADATVSKEEDGDTVYMVIDGLTQDDIIDIFENEYNIDDVDTYFTYDGADDELDDVESDDDARAAAEADMQDEYGDDYQDMDEDYGLDDEGEWLDIPGDDDARDVAIDDMKDEYGDDYVDMDESIDDEYLDDDDDYDDMIPDYDEVDPDDPDALDARDDAYADMDADGELDDDLYDETYEDADEEFADEDSLNDSDDEFDECMEDKEFECYESKNDRHLKRKKLLEKKKGCCPGKKRNGKRLVNLSEALKMRKNGLTTKDIVRSAKKTTLNESIINRAINKVKNESVNKKAELQMKRRELLALKESIGAEKFEFIRKAMKSGKKNLYEKKTINGKNITEYTSKELLELLNTVKAQHTKLMKSYKSLNESASKSTKRELRDSILNKEKLMNILDEELTYRLTFKKLSKSKRLNEDEETQDNPLEPLPVDPTGTDDASDDSDDSDTDNVDDSSIDENPDTDEEVELSRVVITVANQAAADELKQSLVDAGVPDDAIEFEDEDDETDDTDDDSDSDSSDNTDDENSDDTSNTDDNASNESLHYNKFKKLLEDDNDDSTDDANADNSTDDDSDSEDADTDDSTDDGDSDSDNDDKPVKVILTNTDYVNDLADVLNNEYGITKEEFEDMIGGQIVDDDSDSTDDSNSEDDSDSEDKSDDDKKEDKPSTNGDDAVDAMSQEELDKLFGGN